MIYILTGDIRSGKTTALLNWTNARADVDGLLCPDDESGKRYCLKVKQKESFVLETEDENELLEIIGNFKFLKSSFNKANEFLITLNEKQENKYVIIDELGRLELKKEGLHRSAEALIPNYLSDETQHLIVVVREYLLEEIIAFYNISEYKLITKSDLTKNSFT